MITDRDIEFEIKLLKAIIKIAKEVILEGKNPIRFYEEIEDKDTAFVFGVLTAIRSPYFSQALNNNFEWVLRKLKEGKSEEEIIEEFKRKIKSDLLDDYVMYGG